MEPMQPIVAVLITVEPRRDMQPPSRRLPAPPPNAVEIEVRIPSISSGGCVVTGYKDAADELPTAWLKLPGLVAARISAWRTGPDELTCEFAQPLYPTELETALGRRAGGTRRAASTRPRCSFL
jgi:hypothetical protein